MNTYKKTNYFRKSQLNQVSEHEEGFLTAFRYLNMIIKQTQNENNS